MNLRPVLGIILAGAGLAAAQEPAPNVAQTPATPREYVVTTGAKVPLTLINSISTKNSAEGDRVYLETSFPVLVNGRIVIPVGSYVAGTVTQIKKPGRVKGKGEIYIRFDNLTLPNGVTRDFHARIGGMDAASSGQLDRAEGVVRSDGNKGGDMRTVGEAAGAGASVGAIAGSAAGRPGLGVGVGAGAGAVAGLIGILATRGPDAVLNKGATVEMVLDRNITFSDAELDFGNYQAPRAGQAVPAGEQGQQNNGTTIPRRRFPF